MEEKTLISAIITTHKREPSMVSRALDSILAQTYRNIEIIVVDDSPSDYPFRGDVQAIVLGKKAIEKSISIRYIQHDKNMGACVARNTGMNASNGEVIAYLDDDDEWMPEKLEKQLQVMQYSNAAMVYCGCICKNEATGESRERKTEYHRGNIFKRLLYYNFVDSTSVPLIKKKCLLEVKGFDPLMQSAQDYDVWLRLAQEYEVDYVAEPLVIYHEHAGEKITSNPRKKIQGLERLNKKYQKIIESNAKLWWRRNIVLTPYYAAIGEEIKAKNLWRRCVKRCPMEVFENLKYLRAIVLIGKTNKNE